MNIKSTLYALVMGIVVCLTALPVLAGTFRNAQDEHQNSFRKNLQGDRYRDDDRDNTQRPHKFRSDKPTRDELPRQKHHNEKQRQRDIRNDHNDAPILKREKHRLENKQPAIRVDRDRQTRPVKRFDKHRHDRTPTAVIAPANRHPKMVTRVKRPKHRIIYRNHTHRKYRYIQGPWYYTRYISPFPRHYHPIGFRINILPSPYVRIVVGGYPYFYYSGVYYQPYRSGYIVVDAPFGAFVSSLPEGFIAFTIGSATYYYVNDTYYMWDDYREGYVVVEKPAGADGAIDNATSQRLMVYPNKGQTEEQQDRDRYECHRWAVTQTGFDPTLEDEEYSSEDNDLYRRAIAACLEGRDYTVK